MEFSGFLAGAIRSIHYSNLIKAGKIEARRSKIIRDIVSAATQAEKEAAANTSWDDI